MRVGPGLATDTAGQNHTGFRAKRAQDVWRQHHGPFQPGARRRNQSIDRSLRADQPAHRCANAPYAYRATYGECAASPWDADATAHIYAGSRPNSTPHGHA